MKPLERKGFSRIEVFCILGICILLALILFWAVRWNAEKVAKGDDSMMIRSAETVATLNLADTGCVVSGCSRLPGEICSHMNAEGISCGYYDPLTKKICEDKPCGYNEYKIMTAGDTEYEGPVKTMVIEISGQGDSITSSWVEGD